MICAMALLAAALLLQTVFLVQAVPQSLRLFGQPTPHPGSVYDFFYHNHTKGVEAFDVDNADFDTLRNLFTFAGEEVLKTAGREDKGITVFAPTDEALTQSARDVRQIFNLANTTIPTEEGAAWDVYKAWFKTMDDPKATMSRILRFHIVIDGRFDFRELTEDLPSPLLNTSSGEVLLISGVTVNNGDRRFENPQLTMDCYVTAENGIVFAIDRMLFPDPNVEASDPEPVDPGAEPGIQATPSPTPPVPTEQSAGAGGGDTASDDPAPSPASPGSTPANSAQSGTAACFPASVFVHLNNGSMLPISQLSAGHVVVSSTKRRVSSPVYLFSHREHETMHDFVRITTQHGYEITLTSGHYLYVNGRRTAANRVRLGDVLHTIDGDSIVTAIANVRERGLFAPHTLHGDLVVNGILVSSYTTAVSPRIAHMLLWPLRMLVRAGLAVEPLGGLLYYGSPRLATIIPSGYDVY